MMEQGNSQVDLIMINESLKNAFDALHEGVFILDTNFNVVYLNGSAQQFAGVDFPSLFDEACSDHFGAYDAASGDLLKTEEYPIIKAFGGELTRDYEFYLENKVHKEKIYISISTAVLRNESGAVEYAIGVCRDVTPKYMERDALKESNEELFSIAEGRKSNLSLIQDLLIESRDASVHQYLDFATNKIMEFFGGGYACFISEQSPIKSYSYSSKAPEKTLKIVEKLTRQLLITHGDIGKKQLIRIFNADDIKDEKIASLAGKISAKSIVILPTRVSHAISGSLVFFTEVDDIRSKIQSEYLSCVSMLINRVLSKIVFDIKTKHENTQLNQDLQAKAEDLVSKNRQIENLSKAKDDFLEKMSHELRTPLNAIIGYTEMSLEDLQMCIFEDVTNNLQKIKESGTILLGIVNSILKYSELSSEDQLMCSTFSVEKMLTEVQDSCRTYTQRFEKELKIEPGANVGNITSDYFKLCYVIRQVIANACKFSGGKEISLKTKHSGSNVIFLIEDLYGGIDPDVKPYVFDPFSQGRATYSATHEGIGLGLSITKRMIEIMGGTIEMKEGSEHGTLVEISIPAEVPPIAANDVSESSLSSTKSL
ncbi:MAG: ATP-binding protein [Alphaproteobacteria bacterium]